MTDRIGSLHRALAELGLGPQPQSLIDGAFCDGDGAEIILTDPFTEETLFTYRDAGADLARAAADAADRAQKQWVTNFSAADRGRVMQEFSRNILAHAAPLAHVEALTAGKPIRDCAIEIAKVAEMFAYYGGWADKLHGAVIPVPSGHLNFTKRMPLGVVFQITPWNAPAFTGGWQIAPAIATGNGVVIKPSELTPLTTVALAHLGEAAGVPRGLVNVLAGLGPTTGAAAIAAPAIRKVIFVGSPGTGRIVAGAAATALKPAVLELGGKSANIVFDDAHLDQACLGAQAAIFAAAGQSCVAGSRLLVQKSIHRDFVDRMARGMARITLGDPLDPDTEIGPISTRTQRAHVTGMIDAARDAGATIHSPAPRPGPGFFVPPTILDGLDSRARPAQEEIFGPVVTVLPFADEAEAIALANDTEFGLAGAVWTADIGRAHRVADAVRAGTFWINSYKAIHVSSPFGGALNSGWGRSSGTDALMEYTAAKSIWLDQAPVARVAFGYVPDGSP